jgi:hypothetical protein
MDITQFAETAGSPCSKIGTVNVAFGHLNCSLSSTTGESKTTVQAAESRDATEFQDWPAGAISTQSIIKRVTYSIQAFPENVVMDDRRNIMLRIETLATCW